MGMCVQYHTGKVWVAYHTEHPWAIVCGRAGILRRGLVEDVNIVHMKGFSEVASLCDWMRLKGIYIKQVL